MSLDERRETESARRSSSSSWSVAAWRLGRILLLIGFVFLVGRFWRPYDGFTYFLQIDGEVAAKMVPALRDGPIYVHSEPGSYDGGYYVQVATDPTLRDPALGKAIDDVGYRARRILPGAIAWCLGGGEAVETARWFAALNVALWFGLAAWLWRVFPVGDWRGNLAWMALLFGAGVLYSVRCSLPDFGSALLLAGALHLAERGRTGWSAGLLGLAGLTRETSVLGLAALWPGSAWRERFSWKLVGWLVAAVLPIALWVVYVRLTLGGSSAGIRNFNWWPFAGWLANWRPLTAPETWADNPWLVVRSVLEHIALLAQAAYLLLHPKKDCPWWRTGIAYVILMAFLGEAVWEGLPNAATRVLLPLTLVFNVRAVRDRAFIAWLLLGNLSVPTGVHALWFPPDRSHELPSHSTWSDRHLLETDDRWFNTERNWKRDWAWCPQDGNLTLSVWPRVPQVKLQLELRGITPRELQVSHLGRVIWQGRIESAREWITLPSVPVSDGRIVLSLHTDAPPVTEGTGVYQRQLGFSCSGVRRLPE